MKTTPMLCITALMLAAAGCAHDTNGQAKSAEARQRAAESQVTIDGKPVNQAPVAAAPQPAARPEQGQDRAQADRDLKEADAKVTQDRQDFSARSRERLQKIDSRANDVSVRANNTNAKTRNDVTTDWQAYSRQRDVISQQLNNIYSVSNDQWNTTKLDVKAKLDELDTLVDRMEKRIQ